LVYRRLREGWDESLLFAPIGTRRSERNRRGRVEIDGVYMSVAEIAARSGASVDAIAARLRSGWEGERLLQPSRKQVGRRAIGKAEVQELAARGLSTYAIADRLGCSHHTVLRRLRQDG
jgi:DNA-binding NarL/FixJ family response regulator